MHCTWSVPTRHKVAKNIKKGPNGDMIHERSRDTFARIEHKTPNVEAKVFSNHDTIYSANFIVFFWWPL